MFPMKKPVSILKIFRRKLWIMAIFATAFTSLISLLSAFYILESIINQTAQQEIKQYQTALNNSSFYRGLKNISKENQNASMHLPIEPLHTVLITTQDGSIIYQNSPNSSVSTFEKFINSLFFKKPLIATYNNQKDNGIIELQIQSHSFLIYYALILSIASIILFILPILIWFYIFRSSRRLYQNIQPVIQTLHDFNPHDTHYKRAPYSFIQEIQIFNDCYHLLLDKIENTKQILVEQNTILNFQATHDALTTLPNRQYFQQTLARDFNLNLNSYMVVLFIDSNKFKEINDTYGHQTGDAVLIETAKRLRKTLRNDDFVARLGGDEFAAILKRVEKHEDLVIICEKLVRCCDEPLQFDGNSIEFSFSVGASYAYHSKNIDEFLHHADLAMYQAKKSDQKWHIYKRGSAFPYISEPEDEL